MAISDRNKGILTGLVLGVGAATLFRAFGKPLREAARPLTKAGVRSLLEARDKGEEWIAGAGESLSDIVAEVRAEREAKRAEALAASRGSPRPSAAQEGVP